MLNLNERQRQTLIWLTVGLVLIVALILLGPVLSPFIAAIILGYALLPFVDRLQKWKIPRPLAAAIVLVVAVALILSVLLMIIPIVQKEVAQIRAQLPAISAQITEQLIPRLNQWLGLQIKLDANSIRQWLTEHVSSGGTDIAAYVFNYVKSGWSAALEVLGVVFLVPVVLFYVLLDWPRIKPKLTQLVPPRWVRTASGYASEIDSMLSQYIRGQMKVMASLVLFYCVALAIARFDLWLPIGVLSGILVFIPYLGFALGLVFALGAGLLQFGILKGLVTVAIIYGIGQVLESVVLTPKMVGEQIGLHPLAVILALLAFGYLFGFAGVLLALPLAATLAVALRHLRGHYLSSSFYQRK